MSSCATDGMAQIASGTFRKGSDVHDPVVALKGIEKSRFLACSGPPVLEYPQGGQDQMSFVTNLKQGQAIGISSPTALAPESCSVNAVFENSRLVSATFSGNQTMCQLVFGPCLQK